MLHSSKLFSFPHFNSHNSKFHTFIPPFQPYTVQTYPKCSKPCLAQLTATATTSAVETEEVENEEGPIELPPQVKSSSPLSSDSTLFATTDDPTPLQLSTSVLLTGAITVFLFRSIRRRAKRAKEMKYRSSGVENTETKKTVADEALERLKTMKLNEVEDGKPPSPAQTFLGGITAGVIALILYKFTTTIEAALNNQTLSDTFSVRQITITIRTFVNGMCYLATFVFGLNSIGLVLYSIQLALNSLMEGPVDKARSSADIGLPTIESSDNISAADEKSSGINGDNL